MRLVVRYARPTHWLVFSRCVPRLPVSVSDADWQQRIHVHDSLEDDGTRLDCSRLVVVRAETWRREGWALCSVVSATVSMVDGAYDIRPWLFPLPYISVAYV